LSILCRRRWNHGEKKWQKRERLRDAARNYPMAPLRTMRFSATFEKYENDVPDVLGPVNWMANARRSVGSFNMSQMY